MKVKKNIVSKDKNTVAVGKYERQTCIICDRHAGNRCL